jgi:hypothetical protein
MEKVQQAFDKASLLLFGQQLGQLGKYEEWLFRHVPLGRMVKSKGKTLFVPDFGGIFKHLPDNLIIPPEYFDEVGKQSAVLEKGETLSSIRAKMGVFARYVTDVAEGNNFDTAQCTFFKNLVHGYKVIASYDNKCMACSSWSDFSEYCFGLYRTFHSNFCINCYHSNKLTCCFEMDGCNSCSYSYFCHNCENLQDCILCFNVKNLQYAVGNVVVGREKFMQVKKELQGALVSELKATHKVERSLYNLLG